MKTMFKLFDVIEPKIKNVKLDTSKRIKIGNYTQRKKYNTIKEK